MISLVSPFLQTLQIIVTNIGLKTHITGCLQSKNTINVLESYFYHPTTIGFTLCKDNIAIHYLYQFLN